MQKKSLVLVGILLAGLMTLAASCSSELNFDWDDHYRYTETMQQTIPFVGKQTLMIENSVGEIKIESGAQSAIEMTATKKAKHQEDLSQLHVEIQETPTGVEIRSVHPEHQSTKWAVDYVLKIPAGTGVRIDQGVGEISVANHQGGATTVKLGVGDLKMEHIQLTSLSADVGVGDIILKNIDSSVIEANIGTGDLNLRLKPDASFTVDAEVGMGDVTIKGFPNMNLSRKGFIAHSVNGMIGQGSGKLHLHAGVGDITVRPLE
ncbi:DUF4097 family beta strand repeat protein [Candidatus Acetothermia bacterium]|nr:DUF4097 family beta strand repeat protein [Candidatus Acetothermia bacterium]